MICLFKVALHLSAVRVHLFQLNSVGQEAGQGPGSERIPLSEIAIIFVIIPNFVAREAVRIIATTLQVIASITEIIMLALKNHTGVTYIVAFLEVGPTDGHVKIYRVIIEAIEHKIELVLFKVKAILEVHFRCWHLLWLVIADGPVVLTVIIHGVGWLLVTTINGKALVFSGEFFVDL